MKFIIININIQTIGLGPAKLQILREDHMVDYVPLKRKLIGLRTPYITKLVKIILSTEELKVKGYHSKKNAETSRPIA